MQAWPATPAPRQAGRRRAGRRAAARGPRTSRRAGCWRCSSRRRSTRRRRSWPPICPRGPAVCATRSSARSPTTTTCAGSSRAARSSRSRRGPASSPARAAPRRPSRAVDALHAVDLERGARRARRPDADQIAELAERLALVIELVRGAALAAHRRRATPARRAERSGASGRPPAAPRRSPAEARSDAARRAVRPVRGRRRRRAVRVSAAAPTPPAPRPRRAIRRRAAPSEPPRRKRCGSARSRTRSPAPSARARRCRCCWPSSRTPTACSRSSAPARPARPSGGSPRPSASAVRRQDILACETDTRAWIIARDTGRAGPRRWPAGSRRRSGRGGPWRGAPLAVSVGVAVLGEDGRDSASLIEAAEEARFAAAASGIAVVPASAIRRPRRRPDRGSCAERQRAAAVARVGAGSETAPIVAVPSMPSARAVASVRSQSASLAYGPRSITGHDHRAAAVVDRDLRAALQRAVRDAERRCA